MDVVRSARTAENRGSWKAVVAKSSWWPNDLALNRLDQTRSIDIVSNALRVTL